MFINCKIFVKSFIRGYKASTHTTCVLSSFTACPHYYDNASRLLFQISKHYVRNKINLTGKDLMDHMTAFCSGAYLQLPTVVLNLGESASGGTGMTISTLLAVDRRLN